MQLETQAAGQKSRLGDESQVLRLVEQCGHQELNAERFINLTKRICMHIFLFALVNAHSFCTLSTLWTGLLTEDILTCVKIVIDVQIPFVHFDSLGQLKRLEKEYNSE